MAEDAISTWGNQVIEPNINMVNSKLHFNIIAGGNFSIEVQRHRVNTSSENLKVVPFTNNTKLVSLASITLIHLKMKTIRVCKAVGKSYMRARNFVDCEGLSDTICKSPSSREASKHNKNVRTTISASGPENIRVAREGSYLESRNSSRGISEQHFSGGKKDEGNYLIINLKKNLMHSSLMSPSKWKVCIFWSFV